MQPERRIRRTCRRATGVAMLATLAAFGGCSDMPFDVVPVQGKVTYTDGSPIKANSLLVTFTPVDAPTVDGMTAPGGQTYVNAEDGTFSSVTTRRPGDGLFVGRHKVVVVAFEPGRDQRPRPSRAVPSRYHKTTTTPLEVDVESANQFLEIKVDKE